MEETAEHWDEFWRTSNVRYTHDTTIAAIEGLKIDNVLEIGAGSGRDLQELKARGHSVAFADWSAEAVKRFSHRNPGVPSLRIDARKMPFCDNSFELVMSLGLLEHFDREERQEIFQEQFRVARRFVLVDVPQKFAPAAVITRTLTLLRLWPHGEEEPFTYGQLLREVDESVQVRRTAASYGRELIPLPRNLKGRVYSLLPGPVRRAYVGIHPYLTRGLAGSFAIVFEKAGTQAG